MGLQLVRLTREVDYGVYPATPAAGTVADIFLPVDDAMTVRTMPRFWTVKDAAQGNRNVRRSVGRKAVEGTLQTHLFPTQAPLLLSLAAALQGTNPCYDLPSFTIDHAVYTDQTCLVFYRRYVGCKFGRFSLSCDDSDQGCLTSARGDVVGSIAADITAADFPTPNLSAYPPDDPYLFFQTAENTGQLTIGTQRHDYKTLTIDINNTLQPFGGERRYNQRVGWFGREVGFSTRLLFRSRADRDAFEAGAKQAVSVKFDDGTHTCLVDFGSRNNIDSVADQFPLGNYYTQTLALTALMDPTLPTPTDLTITLT